MMGAKRGIFNIGKKSGNKRQTHKFRDLKKKQPRQSLVHILWHTSKIFAGTMQLTL